MFREPAWPGSGEGSMPGFPAAACSVYFTGWRQVSRGQDRLLLQGCRPVGVSMNFGAYDSQGSR